MPTNLKAIILAFHGKRKTMGRPYAGSEDMEK